MGLSLVQVILLMSKIHPRFYVSFSTPRVGEGFVTDRTCICRVYSQEKEEEREFEREKNAQTAQGDSLYECR
jgi:hypothetical protein